METEIRSDLLNKKGILFHYFGTRKNGIPKEDVERLNFDTRNSCPKVLKDNIDQEIKNSNLVCMDQVHSNQINFRKEPGVCLDTDGIITRTSNLYLTVRTADCAPVLIFAPGLDTVAALHCGWRGVTKGIIEKAISLIEDKYGGNPEEIKVAVGPSLRKCCFEIGEEILYKFDDIYIEKKNNSYYLKFMDLIVSKLLSKGVVQNNIDIIDQCTKCNQNKFYSYRGDENQTGRMINVVGLQ